MAVSILLNMDFRLSGSFYSMVMRSFFGIVYWKSFFLNFFQVFLNLEMPVGEITEENWFQLIVIWWDVVGRLRMNVCTGGAMSLIEMPVPALVVV